MTQLKTNIAPTGYPVPRDMRHTPDAVAASAYQAVHSTNAPPKADPIRAVVVANLALAGIVTNGKTDDQLLEDYGQLLRRVQIEQTYRIDQRARQLEADAWNNYSINDPMVQKAAPVTANAGAGEFDGYSINDAVRGDHG